jgi:serine racemase
MAGQGTIALELLEQFSELVSESEPGGGGAELDAIVVPVSGCGMISGIAIAAKTQFPDLKIIAAEPSGANNCPDVVMSLEAGELIGPASCGTALPPIACASASLRAAAVPGPACPPTPRSARAPASDRERNGSMARAVAQLQYATGCAAT